MEFWNLKCLPKPPEISVQYDENDYKYFLPNNAGHLQDISPEKWVREVRWVISEGARKMRDSDDLLKMEKKLLRSNHYFNKDAHRSEKFMQYLKMIRTCLRNWSELQIVRLLFNTMEMIPLAFKVVNDIYLPTCQRIHFLMLRLLGGFKLLVETASRCVKTASVLRSKLMCGHSHATIYLLYGFMSRIRALCLDLANRVCKTYTTLHPLLEKVILKSKLQYPKSLQKDLEEELMMSITVMDPSSEFPAEQYDFTVKDFLGGILEDTSDVMNSTSGTVYNDSIEHYEDSECIESDAKSEIDHLPKVVDTTVVDDEDLGDVVVRRNDEKVANVLPSTKRKRKIKDKVNKSKKYKIDTFEVKNENIGKCVKTKSLQTKTKNTSIIKKKSKEIKFERKLLPNKNRLKNNFTEKGKKLPEKSKLKRNLKKKNR